jgi:hypothetical protein
VKVLYVRLSPADAKLFARLVRQEQAAEEAKCADRGETVWEVSENETVRRLIRRAANV